MHVVAIGANLFNDGLCATIFVDGTLGLFADLAILFFIPSLVFSMLMPVSMYKVVASVVAMPVPLVMVPVVSVAMGIMTVVGFMVSVAVTIMTMVGLVILVGAYHIAKYTTHCSTNYRCLAVSSNGLAKNGATTSTNNQAFNSFVFGMDVG